MSHTDPKLKKTACRTYSAALIVFPAIALGIFAMISEGVSPALWGQQAAAFVLCFLLICPARHIFKRISGVGLAAVLVIFLSLSLLGAGAGGAKRWVDLGVFNVNVAFLVLPALLVLMDGIRPLWLLLCAAAVLSIQPDCSQLTALIAAAMPYLWKRRHEMSRICFYLGILAVLMVICLRLPVMLEPVSYCEGVLALLGEKSTLLLMAGAGALAIIPGFWMFRFFKEKSIWMLSLAAYYTVTILFSLSLEYPMPLMGFGLSPILGYGLAAAIAPEA